MKKTIIGMVLLTSIINAGTIGSTGIKIGFPGSQGAGSKTVMQTVGSTNVKTGSQEIIQKKVLLGVRGIHASKNQNGITIGSLFGRYGR
jgi:hypothetical protein